jgi:hypothetical protein
MIIKNNWRPSKKEVREHGWCNVTDSFVCKQVMKRLGGSKKKDGAVILDYSHFIKGLGLNPQV